MMKTAITILQEMMVKLGEAPEFECISQSGPAHEAMFEVRCVARGVTATAVGRSKREAKQEAARRVLVALGARELPAPAPAPAPAPDPAPPKLDAASRTHVALLKELCEEYRLGGVEYAVVGDTGPAHARLFTVEARLGDAAHSATATTKKAARQLAAQSLYTYLRQNLSRTTADFDEKEALSRAVERAMDRYAASQAASHAASDAASHAASSRPRLAQRVADYHTGLAAAARASGSARAPLPAPAPAPPSGLIENVLFVATDAEQHAAALAALSIHEDDAAAVAAAAKALNLHVVTGQLSGVEGALYTLSLEPAWPPACVAARAPPAAAAAARRLLQRALRHPPAAVAAPAAPAAPPAPSDQRLSHAA